MSRAWEWSFLWRLQWPQRAQIVTSALLGQFSGHLGSQGHRGGKGYWFLSCLNPQQGLSEKVPLLFAPCAKNLPSLPCPTDVFTHKNSHQTEGGVWHFEEQRWGSWLSPCWPARHNLLSLFTKTLLNQSLLFFVFSWHSRVLFGKDINGNLFQALFGTQSGIDSGVVNQNPNRRLEGSEAWMHRDKWGNLGLVNPEVRSLTRIGNLASTQAQAHREEHFCWRDSLVHEFLCSHSGSFKRDSKRKPQVLHQAHAL